MVIDYQMRSKVARQTSIEFDQMKSLNSRLHTKAEAKTKELAETKSIVEQQAAELADLRQVAASHQRALEELKALGKYSHEVKARADRLREGLVYLDKITTPVRMADQARAVLECMNGLKPRIHFSSNTFAQLEADVKRFDAEVNEIPPVSLGADELAPLGAYVTVSDEFEELLEVRAPPKRHEDQLMKEATHDGEEIARDGETSETHRVPPVPQANVGVPAVGDDDTQAE